jgi:hypothetical protein
MQVPFGFAQARLFDSSPGGDSLRMTVSVCSDRLSGEMQVPFGFAQARLFDSFADASSLRMTVAARTLLVPGLFWGDSRQDSLRKHRLAWGMRLTCSRQTAQPAPRNRVPVICNLHSGL